MSGTDSRLLVQIGSYNANLQGSLGLPQDLVDWLGQTLTVSSFLSRSAAPDIVAIGFQELLPLHLGLTGLSRGVMNSRDALIRSQIEEHAPNKEKYILVAKAVYVGVALLIYARDDGVGRLITDVQSQWTGFGPAWMGNKGAVGIRFRVRIAGISDSNDDGSGEIFTFVNTHLTAHTWNHDRRLRDYSHIVSSLLFPPTAHQKNLSTIYDTTHLFFLGDLNFRLNLPETLTKAALEEQIRSETAREQLKEYDMLYSVWKEGLAFQGLREAEFWKFQCSYKFELGEVDQYSTKRTPAWTDRILYTTASDSAQTPALSNITPLLYTSIPSYTTSDHKPILALLLLPAPPTTPGTPRLLTHRSDQKPDPLWNVKRWVGKLVGWYVGWVWTLFAFVGMGNTVVGAANFLCGIAGFAWWRTKTNQ